MKALLSLLIISFIAAITHSFWKRIKKKPEIPDKPFRDSPETGGMMSDDSDSDDAGE